MIMSVFYDKADGILQYITDHLKQRHINYRHDNRDGRVNSSLNEGQIIDELINFFAIDEYIKNNKFNIKRAQMRDWYDFAITDESDPDFFVPVNVKVTELGTADNLNCTFGIYFALTGMLPTGVSYRWGSFFEKLKTNINKFEDKDYYFLVANKGDNKDFFWNSLKRLNCITSNGNNLPFQANWDDNRIQKARSHAEAGVFILNTLKDSVYKRAQIKDFFDTYIKPQIEEYEKQINKAKEEQAKEIDG